MAEGIGNAVSGALDKFEHLFFAIRESDEDTLRSRLLPSFEDDLARFKVWVGNSGAHRTGRASLEYRLRDASHIRHQVLRLLRELQESLDEAQDIIEGRVTPWDESEDEVEWADGLATDTEISQIALDITDLVDCLLRLSVSIQNPSPHDRFVASSQTDTSAYEGHDIQHVQQKFQGIDVFLAQRLGKANSRRRQYFNYREAHFQTLSHGLEAHGNTTKSEIVPSTLAGSIPNHRKDGAFFDISGDDYQSDGEGSQTSFATSVSNPKTLKVPPMPEGAPDRPCLCPFCQQIISIRSTAAWKKHVFEDLQPYSCLAALCTAPDQTFSRRNAWMQHMLGNHLRLYRCPCGCGETFFSAKDSQNHLLRTHPGAIPESHIDSIVDLSSRPFPQDARINCPFCSRTLISLKQYRRHVGNHQQDLALFALPNIDNADECEDDDSNSKEDSDESTSDEVELSFSGGSPSNPTEEQHNDVNTVPIQPVEFQSRQPQQSLEFVPAPVTQHSSQHQSRQQQRESRVRSDLTSNTVPSSRSNEYFVPRHGIDPEVIQADITRYLGNDALVRPGHYEDPQTGQIIQGYYITCFRQLTTAMIDDLKRDSARWAKEKRRILAARELHARNAQYDTPDFGGPRYYSHP